MLAIIIQLLFAAALLYIVWLMVYSMAKGAPYAPMRKTHMEQMIKMLSIKKGEKAVDVGSGDGRVVIALARAGANAHGFEINPFLVLWSLYNVWRAGLWGKAHIHLQNFITADFSTFDIFTTYLTQFGMPNVEKKLGKEAKKSARIGVDFFKLPTWKASRHVDTIYIYEVGRNRK